jgi:acyl-CoA thioesterase FadM
MKKIKVTMFEVRVGDINYGGYMGNDQIVIQGSTKQLAFEYEKRKVTSLPDDFRNKLLED